jgi:flavin reductase (DIM6/NTAB) family NADH-FMN oxidoreductase RutF
MSSEGPRVASEEFRRACGRFATGVAIASVLDADGTPHGLTVNSFASVSLHPPLILICLGHKVSVMDAFRASAHFGINMLADHQRALAERFARKGRGRFDGLEWQRGETGVPLLAGVLATIECAVHARHTAGDHDILVGQVVRTRVAEGAPLVYFASRYRELAPR